MSSSGAVSALGRGALLEIDGDAAVLANDNAPNRVIATLARGQVTLDVKTVGLCFLARLYLRADTAALSSFEAAAVQRQDCHG